jgi:uncharacterized protein (DUF736 family)
LRHSAARRRSQPHTHSLHRSAQQLTPPPATLQHITNQLEYRLIKRRLETGAAGWTEWTEEEEEEGYVEVRLELEVITATIAAAAAPVEKDNPLTLSLTPAWADLTDDDEPSPSAIAAAARRQPEVSQSPTTFTPSPDRLVGVAVPPPPPPRLAELLHPSPAATAAAAARRAEISPPPPPPPRNLAPTAQGVKCGGGDAESSLHSGGGTCGEPDCHGGSTRSLGDFCKGGGLRPPQSTPTRRSEERVRCLHSSVISVWAHFTHFSTSHRPCHSVL